VPDLNWNKTVWSDSYHWNDAGEEWSTTWGGSEAQWFGSIYPRVHRFLPAQRILEIALGFGRWTRYLLPACEEFIGIDLSNKALRLVKNDLLPPIMRNSLQMTGARWRQRKIRRSI